MQLLNVLEQVHSAGFVFNDLKLDNILLDSSSFKYKMGDLVNTKTDIFGALGVRLIDFGFATEFLDRKTGSLKNKERLDLFRGNIIFSTANQLKFHSTGRRDDVISLFYLLVYLFKKGEMPCLPKGTNAPDLDKIDLFKVVSKARLSEK